MDYQDIADRVRAAYESKTPLAVRGGGSKTFIGRRPEGEPLEVSDCRGIVDYDPSELVLSARCGTPLAEIEALLDEHGQMLPFEAPMYSDAATVGGVVAAGVSGPRRPWVGSVRDFVLGTVCASGRGEVLRFGGRVMKNVAGYDLSRLMVGTLGTLGVILETSFKVLPAPRSEATRVLEFDSRRAIEYLAEIGATPVPISASCHHEGRLYLRLSGSDAGVRAGCELIGGDELPDGAEFWTTIRNQTHSFFDGEEPLWRLSVAPATPQLDVDGQMLTEWGGALRWLRGARDFESLSNEVRRFGGNVTAFRYGDRDGEVYPAPDAVTYRLFDRLKDSFDPARILNPGRLYRDL